MEIRKPTRLLDCHTHSTGHETGAIHSVCSDAWEGLAATDDAGLRSIGLHPWHLPSVDCIAKYTSGMERLCATYPQIVAIGECGLDKTHSDTPLSAQLLWLESQVLLACRLRYPMILHCVRAWDEMIALRKRMLESFESIPPMVLHGFRARASVAQMMLRAGFTLSFGVRHHEESVRLAYERHALLVETDEIAEGESQCESIQRAYGNLATTLGITSELLTEQVEETAFWQAIKALRIQTSKKSGYTQRQHPLT